MNKFVLFLVFAIVSIAIPTYGQDILLTSNDVNEISIDKNLSVFNVKSSWIYNTYSYSGVKHDFAVEVNGDWIIVLDTDYNPITFTVQWTGSGPFTEDSRVLTKGNSVEYSGSGHGILSLRILGDGKTGGRYTTAIKSR